MLLQVNYTPLVIMVQMNLSFKNTGIAKKKILQYSQSLLKIHIWIKPSHMVAPKFLQRN